MFWQQKLCFKPFVFEKNKMTVNMIVQIKPDKIVIACSLNKIVFCKHLLCCVVVLDTKFCFQTNCYKKKILSNTRWQLQALAYGFPIKLSRDPSV